MLDFVSLRHFRWLFGRRREKFSCCRRVAQHFTPLCRSSITESGLSDSAKYVLELSLPPPLVAAT